MPTLRPDFSIAAVREHVLEELDAIQDICTVPAAEGACLDCHAAIHGSNHPSSPYLGY